jgi:hypothetical protein
VHRTKFCMFCQKITCFENRSFKHNSLLMTQFDNTERIDPDLSKQRKT